MKVKRARDTLQQHQLKWTITVEIGAFEFRKHVPYLHEDKGNPQRYVKQSWSSAVYYLRPITTTNIQEKS